MDLIMGWTIVWGQNRLDGPFEDHGFDGLDRDRDTKFNGMIDCSTASRDNGKRPSR
jgi:hypothetical protein